MLYNVCIKCLYTNMLYATKVCFLKRIVEITPQYINFTKFIKLVSLRHENII